MLSLSRSTKYIITGALFFTGSTSRASTVALPSWARVASETLTCPVSLVASS
jgi:hypothetical protein